MSPLNIRTALLGLAAVASAKDYYLDCTASSGGDGSKSSPYSTIHDVNHKTFSAGDTINVKSGTTCEGSLSPNGSGSKDQPIKLTSYGDSSDLPIINGTGNLYGVHFRNQDYWEVSKIAIVNPAEKESTKVGLNFVADDSKTHYGIYVHDVEVYDVAGATNKASQASAFSASSCIGVQGTSGSSRYDDVQIYDNYVHDCGGGGIKVRVGQMKNRGKNTHVYNNTVMKVGGDGIIVSYSEGPLIDYNIAGDLGKGKYPYTGGNFAGIWVMGTKDSVMSHNVVYGSVKSVSDSQAFDCDWGNEGSCIVEYNYSHDNAGGSWRNCDGCGTSTGPNEIVRYNIFQNDCAVASNGDKANLRFYNNVIYCPDKDFDFIVPKRTNFTNNIFVGTAKSKLPTGNSISWAKNIFQTVDAPEDDAGKKVSDAGLVNPGHGTDKLDSVDGYKLKDSSPAVDFGEIVASNGGHDFWGNSLPGNSAPNAGAYQN
ncbi:Pectin lyase fold/virulence factor [Ascosphaera apis ARSEF 7405]|uniref:Pectin lyase fold/virulence factor n=1 Tax=Ascosphaera apis ARSEF 7405 TaxID=392613 RepID=A0A167Z680_9EURO|nr:Pectin lyase fold/virulence factor [Ascosphaera apis ARSEF 7405]